IAGDEAILAPGLTVEEDAPRKAKLLVEAAVDELTVAGHGDAQLADEGLRHEAVGKRGLDALRPPVADDEPALVADLVRLGMAAEVVVVVEDEDAPVASHGLTEEVGRGEPRNAGAHDDEVVGLSRVDRVRDRGVATVARAVRVLEGAGILAA